MKTRLRQAVLVIPILMIASSLPASAVTITNVTTNTTLFSDNFESGVTPSIPQTGSWSLFGPDVTVTNAPNPGPAQGSFYLQLFRDSNAIGQGNSRAAFNSSLANPGDVIELTMMVYIPSAADADARAQLMLDDGDFSSARAWVRPDGNGHVEAVGPGFSTSNTGLSYQTDTWQEWQLDYVVGATTFSVIVNGHTVSGLSAPTNGVVGGADLFNGVVAPGSFFLDAVPAVVTGVPEPKSLWLTGVGLLALAGITRRTARSR